jgi:cysteine sulfinate desulfinase/cysteine desulfurase-like protein
MVRLSFGAYTTTSDIDLAVDAVAELATRAGRASATATYIQGPDGTWAPS